MDWVQGHGGWLNPSLELRDGQYGASVFALHPVSRGEVLVRTPRSLTISGDSVLAHSRSVGRNDAKRSPIVAAVARLLAKNQTSEAMSLFVAYQRSLRRHLRAEESSFGPHQDNLLSDLHPFISAMPKAVANALAFSPAELGALRGSQAESIAREMQHSAARQFTHLCLSEPALFGMDCAPDQVSDQDSVLLNDMLWATSMV